MKVNISDKDLDELIRTGKNNKYKKYSKDSMNLSSVRVLNGRVERLLFRELEDGIEITIIELNNDHYGNKK